MTGRPQIGRKPGADWLALLLSPLDCPPATAWIMVPIFWAIYNAIPPLLFFGCVCVHWVSGLLLVCCAYPSVGLGVWSLGVGGGAPGGVRQAWGSVFGVCGLQQ